MLRDTPLRLICCGANAVCDWLLWEALLKIGSTYLYQLGILEQGGVNVELSHVIYDDSTSKTLSVGKQVAQQRGLAGPKQAADERHGQLSLACEVRSCGQYCACLSVYDFCVETYSNSSGSVDCGGGCRSARHSYVLTILPSKGNKVRYPVQHIFILHDYIRGNLSVEHYKEPLRGPLCAEGRSRTSLSRFPTFRMTASRSSNKSFRFNCSSCQTGSCLWQHLY